LFNRSFFVRVYENFCTLKRWKKIVSAC
jgi:hypothetical protein